MSEILVTLLIHYLIQSLMFLLQNISLIFWCVNEGKIVRVVMD